MENEKSKTSVEKKEQNTHVNFSANHANVAKGTQSKNKVIRTVSIPVVENIRANARSRKCLFVTKNLWIQIKSKTVKTFFEHFCRYNETQKGQKK